MLCLLCSFFHTGRDLGTCVAKVPEGGLVGTGDQIFPGEKQSEDLRVETSERFNSSPSLSLTLIFLSLPPGSNFLGVKCTQLQNFSAS